MENLSDVLSHLMSESGIKSAELARKTGVGQPVVYRLMTGATENPQVLTLKPIADFFKVSIDQLLGITPLQHKKPLDQSTLRDMHTKFSTIKTMASALINFLPALTDGYQKAVAAQLTKESIPADLLPLLNANVNTFLQSINHIQDVLLHEEHSSQD